MSDKVRDAVILAGGKGSRLKSIDHSKPMTPIHGKPLITFAIDSLLDSGVENIHVVYHADSADLLALPKLGSQYSRSLNFVENTEQEKGSLYGFNIAKDYVNQPFVMSFADIIVKKKHFQEMLFKRLSVKNRTADLLIQTVNNPSIPFEKNLLVEDGQILEWNKSGIIDPKRKNCEIKSGGFVYLWNKNPFPIAENLMSGGDYSFSSFMQKFIRDNKVMEMPIKDIWDVDTPEDIRKTEELLR